MRMSTHRLSIERGRYEKLPQKSLLWVLRGGKNRIRGAFYIGMLKLKKERLSFLEKILGKTEKVKTSKQ